MTYSSIEFLVAFASFAVLYWVIRAHARRLALLFLASLAFYAYGEVSGLPLLVGVIALTYCAGISISRWPSGRDAILTASIVALLADLALFKYWGFLRETLVVLPDVIPPIALPLGISFFTFEAIAYLVDLRRGVTQVERSPLRLGLFIAVFPHLISGPIMRPAQFLPQLRLPAEFDLARTMSGLRLFLDGLAKKVLLADVAGGIADRVFASPGDASTIAAWTAACAYTLQIYGDFSGYTDMGRGAARMLGLELPLNFDAPYVASSPRDFWRRWHISLSTWLRDYVYIPLGGDRLGRARTFLNLGLTMALGGLWHGAGWTFVLWGVYHGILLMIQRAMSRVIRIPLGLSAGITLFLVVNGWVLFRSRDVGIAVEMFRAMYTPQGSAVPGIGPISTAFVLSAFSATIAAMALIRRRPQIVDRARTRPLTGAAYGLLAAACLTAMLLARAPTPFIYFRF